MVPTNAHLYVRFVSLTIIIPPPPARPSFPSCSSRFSCFYFILPLPSFSPGVCLILRHLSPLDLVPLFRIQGSCCPWCLISLQAVELVSFFSCCLTLPTTSLVYNTVVLYFFLPVLLPLGLPGTWLPLQSTGLYVYLFAGPGESRELLHTWEILIHLSCARSLPCCILSAAFLPPLPVNILPHISLWCHYPLLHCIRKISLPPVFQISFGFFLLILLFFVLYISLFSPLYIFSYPILVTSLRHSLIIFG